MAPRHQIDRGRKRSEGDNKEHKSGVTRLRITGKETQGENGKTVRTIERSAPASKCVEAEGPCNRLREQELARSSLGTKARPRVMRGDLP